MYTYVLLLNANKQSFIDNLSPSDRGQLIELIKKENPPNCLYCPCFAWEFDEDKRVSGCRCTLGGEPNTEKKGNCKIGQNIQAVQEMVQRKRPVFLRKERNMSTTDLIIAICLAALAVILAINLIND